MELPRIMCTCTLYDNCINIKLLSCIFPSARSFIVYIAMFTQLGIEKKIPLAFMLHFNTFDNKLFVLFIFVLLWPLCKKCNPPPHPP